MNAVENTKDGTVTGHYFNSIASILDVLDQLEQLKSNYIAMDNTPITRILVENKLSNAVIVMFVFRLTSLRSTQLNSFGQYVKDEDAHNMVLLSDIQGFYKYSIARFEDCLNRKPM
ncbi:hypothetical protein RO3G_00967 [Rhizopus delemar RA 99-880]|uniref:Uncharacterized protein n=1 Tax=Rhizopus delemar (strain RA 99-880 / ATCC MYA-4621 / FGSC 9543 / NRRL 43880) TaxID=246409 RepID=I1BJ83_RHIO9|nr:hypothetical protein RO3G_00967 [Rhizopus delemar RA 99-880]|eukprot:EIE76263.1 hypothetical protein RO3G_00967 [Rhizopus delemar RA 99-880]